jgi:hypothetical protein
MVLIQFSEYWSLEKGRGMHDSRKRKRSARGSGITGCPGLCNPKGEG